MTALVWDQTGDRIFEAGVDHGVLYYPDGIGISWNGLTSVTANTTNTVEPVHVDGIKVNDIVTVGDYQGVLKAYTYPEEFIYFEGTEEQKTGVYVTAQGPKKFHLSYRTNVGDDVLGVDKGYKIHLLWNVTAVPSTRTYDTLSLDSTPPAFEWNLTAIPQDSDMYRPTAYLFVDSRFVNSDILDTFKETLYGTVGTAPRMPTLQEALNIIN